MRWPSPTSTPFCGFLNDLFAGMVLAGEGIAIYRRFVRKSFMLKTSDYRDRLGDAARRLVRFPLPG